MSTDNFRPNRDPVTNSYSVSMVQNPNEQEQICILFAILLTKMLMNNLALFRDFNFCQNSYSGQIAKWLHGEYF